MNLPWDGAVAEPVDEGHPEPLIHNGIQNPSHPFPRPGNPPPFPTVGGGRFQVCNRLKSGFPRKNYMVVIWAYLGIMMESFEPIWVSTCLEKRLLHVLYPPETPFDRFRSHCGSSFLLGAISSSRCLLIGASDPKLHRHLIAHFDHRRRHHHRKHRLKQPHENQRLKKAIGLC